MEICIITSLPLNPSGLLTTRSLKCQTQVSSTASALPNSPPSNACNRIAPRLSTHSIPLLNGSDSEVDSEAMACDVGEPERSAEITPNQERGRNKPGPLAKSLIKSIKKGQEVLLKQRAGREANYDYAVFQCLIPNDGNSYDLKQIEKALLRMEESHKKDKDKRKLWTTWYFRCCLQMVIEEEYPWQKPYHRKHKTFQGAKAANFIVNKLLKSDGIAAMGVYSALAGRMIPLTLLCIWLIKL